MAEGIVGIIAFLTFSVSPFIEGQLVEFIRCAVTTDCTRTDKAVVVLFAGAVITVAINFVSRHFSKGKC